MSKKLKRTSKKVNTNKKSSGKDLFDMGDKTIPEAKKLANKLNTEFLKALKGTSIPSFQEFAKSKNALDLYFMNQDMLMFTIGDYVNILDRIMKDIISVEVSNEIMDKIKADSIPGFWTPLGTMALTRRMVNVITLSDRPDLGPYLSAHPINLDDPEVTSLTVLDWPAATCMRFTDFNPNRLYQFYNVVKQTVFHLVITEVVDNVPHANLVNPDDLSASTGTNARSASLTRAIYKRYGEEFSKYAQEKYTEWLTDNKDRDDISNDEKIEAYANAVANLISSYSYRILQTMGLSKKSIEGFLKVYGPKKIFDAINLDKLDNLENTHARIVLQYMPLDPNDNSPYARIDLSVATIHRLITNKYQKDAIEFGRGVRGFVHQMMNIIIAGYRKFSKVMDDEEESDLPVAISGYKKSPETGIEDQDSEVTEIEEEEIDPAEPEKEPEFSDLIPDSDKEDQE